MYCISLSSYPSLYDHPNSIWWRAQVMKLLTVQFSWTSCQLSLLKVSSAACWRTFFLYLARSRFTPLHVTRILYISIFKFIFSWFFKILYIYNIIKTWCVLELVKNIIKVTAGFLQVKQNWNLLHIYFSSSHLRILASYSMHVQVILSLCMPWRHVLGVEV